MKRVFALLVFLFVSLTLAACSNEPSTYTGEPPTYSSEPLYFNLPTSESPFNFRVRYFFTDADGRIIGEHERDVYARERTWLEEDPEWQGPSRPPGWWHQYVPLQIVTSMAELAEQQNQELWRREYTENFFENNYLVIIEFTTPHSILEDVLYRIEDDGTLVFRPWLVGYVALMVESRQTVVIELDNRFQPEAFRVVFIENPLTP